MTNTKYNNCGGHHPWWSGPEDRLIFLLNESPHLSVSQIAADINSKYRTTFTRMAILGKKWRLKQAGTI